ncbi:MAG: hypothetical protein JXA33_28670 [Anaerolineae bacterium]|nr:hypothetical protein [Anaerolineae bacterium]
MSYRLGKYLAARWPHLSLWCGALVMLLASFGVLHWYGSKESWYLVPVCLLVGALCTLVRRPLGDWLVALGMAVPTFVGAWLKSPIPMVAGLLYLCGFVMGVSVQRALKKSE